MSDADCDCDCHDGYRESDGTDEVEHRCWELECGLERIRELLRDGSTAQALEEIERTLHPNPHSGAAGYAQACAGKHPFLKVGGNHDKC